MICKNHDCSNTTNKTWGNNYEDYCDDCKENKSRDNYVKDTFHEGKANTFKFSTVIYIIIGLVIPFWLITLPLFWYLAYRSYKSGYIDDNNEKMIAKQTVVEPRSKYDDLEKLKKLLDSGALSEEEFMKEKERVLES